MIYDCFLYNGEKELLEIRLNEFSKCSDDVMHVLVEAAYTHTGIKKPLHFSTYAHKFEKWPIMSVTIEEFPETCNTPREREKYQRNMIKGALKMVNPADDNIVVLADVDEIVNHEVLNSLHLENGFAALMMKKYGYYLNWLEGDELWDRARVFNYQYLKDKSLEEIRNSGYSQTIENAGWHFSWSPERAHKKLMSFSHTELDTVENHEMIERKKNFWNGLELKYVPIDSSFPEFLVKNIHKYKHLICDAK